MLVATIGNVCPEADKAQWLRAKQSANKNDHQILECRLAISSTKFQRSFSVLDFLYYAQTWQGFASSRQKLGLPCERRAPNSTWMFLSPKVFPSLHGSTCPDGSMRLLGASLQKCQAPGPWSSDAMHDDLERKVIGRWSAANSGTNVSF